MRVFMLGWEFPPFISGGLGTACYGLTKAMSELGAEVIFVLPSSVQTRYATHVRLLTPGSAMSAAISKAVRLKNVSLREIDSPLQPYGTADAYREQVEEIIRQKLRGRKSADEVVSRVDYSGDMYAEVHRYAAVAAQLAHDEEFDVVHAHDWMTYPAGIRVATVTGRPLIVHVHSTEFDRSP